MRAPEGQGLRIARPKLVSRARDALAAGPLLLYAGAGSGKTQLLADVAAAEGTVAWLSCGPAEREPERLLRSLMRAVGSAQPEIAAAFGERLAAAPPGQVDPDGAIRELLAEVRELSPEPVLLIVDDGERLEDSPAALALLQEVLRSAGARLRVGLASRRQLDLRVAKLRASGSLAELGAADLAFGPGDCEALIRAARGVAPDDAEVEAVMDATEGWPLGVALLARTGAATRPGGRAVMGPSSEIVAYLEEEVLGRLDAPVRDAVIDSAVATSLRPEVLEALELDADFLDRVGDAGLLTILPGAPETRYHPLLHEALRTILERRRSPDEQRALHARVAASEHDPADAIEHLLAAEDWDAVTGAIVANPELVAVSPRRVRGWVERLPAQSRGAAPILVVRAQLARSEGEHERVVELLTEAVDSFDGDHGFQPWMARFELTMAQFLNARFEETLPVIDGFDAPEAAEAAGPAAPAAGLSVAIALAGVGRMAESDELAARANAHPVAPMLAPLEALRRCHVDVPAGRLEVLPDVIDAAVATVEAADPMTLRPYLLAGWAMVEDDMGNTARALELWADGAEAAAGGLSEFVTVTARAWRAVLLAESGRLADAERELALASHGESGWRGYIYDAAIAAVAARRGDRDETIRAAEAAHAIVSPGAVQHRVNAIDQLVRALAEAGFHSRAEELVEEGLQLEDAMLAGAAGAFYRGRHLALRAWLRHLRHEDGSEDIAGSAAEAGDSWRYVLRKDWKRLAPVVSAALAAGALEPEPTVAAIAAAVPTGDAIGPLTAHPVGAVRAAAIAPAVASGDPSVIRRLPELTEDSDDRVVAVATRALAEPAATVPPLRVQLLGGFALRRGSWSASEADWGRPAAAKLVRFLAIHDAGSVSEDAIFDALWPSLPPDRARRSLRVAASLARKVLSLPGIEDGNVEVAGGSYKLDLGADGSTDAERFERAASEALQAGPDHRLALLQQARSQWTGDPLPQDRFEDWAAAWRSGLVDLHVAVLGRLAETLGEAGDVRGQLSVARELVAADPLDEAAHRQLMLANARIGRRGQALRQFLTCRRQLVSELGVEPSRETHDLHAAILAGEEV